MSITGGVSGAAFGGDTVTLICTESNTTTPDDGYTWYLDGEAISGATAQTHEINPDTHLKSGTYACEANFSTTAEISPDLIFSIYGREQSFYR